MTAKLLCDGCGGDPACEHADEKLQEFGFHVKAHYCSAAAAQWQKYLDERDAHHDECAKHWQERLADLEKGFTDGKNGLKVLAKG